MEANSRTSYGSEPMVERFAQRNDEQLIGRLRSSAPQTVKLAIVYAVLYRFRIPIFRRISAEDSLSVKIFTSTGISGTKLENAKDTTGIKFQTMWTYAKHVISTNRSVPLIINPTLLFHLFRHRPEVLLIQGGMVPNNFITVLYAKLTRTPIVWWSLGRVKGRKFKGISAVYQKLNKWNEKQATCYAGYSSESVRYFIECGYSEERCFNLINVVDTELISKQIADAKLLSNSLRESLNLQDKQVVLFVGSVVETKRLEVLIEAFHISRDSCPNSILLVVGDGPELNAARKQVADLALEEQVVFTGAVYENVAAYFQLGDIMVLPGTGGLAISEAMTHSLPVICSYGDGVEYDLIDEGINGYIVEPGNVKQLADRLCFMLESTDRLNSMGNESRKIIDNRANIGNYMNEMLSAISYAMDTKKK